MIRIYKTLSIALIISSLSVRSESQTLPDYSSFPVHNVANMGVNYSTLQTTFRVYAPTAQNLVLRLYKDGTGGDDDFLISQQYFYKSKNGTWTAIIDGDWHGKFFTYQTRIDNKWHDEVPDIYAHSVGVNGKRGMIVDLERTNPVGWEKDQSPALKSVSDAIIYELHVRDATIMAQSGAKHAGKFLGLAEKGTKNAAGLSTGIDHIKELGITHVHLLPVFDFASVDESKLDQPQYNWGYDPLNYNTPEGSYATNAIDGTTRIKELKTLVQAMHQNGLRVVMDVVYNHTMTATNSYFNQLVPGYYYRQKADGSFSDASGCGNETASDRPMYRKFMLESLKYWVEEYHIDGFRFDLMAIHDIETMNDIATELRKLKPSILLYGEGWTAGDSPLAETSRALKKYAQQLNGIAVFSDDIRDGLKGSVFEHKDRGFASGKPQMEESVKFGIVGAIEHPQIDYSKVNYAKKAYAAQPSQMIAYAECHDNHTLWDRLTISVPGASEADKIKMFLLAQTVVLTSQGIPFLHAGAEFLRTKQGEENSYKSGDAINAMDWERKTTHKKINQYFQGLIKLRKTHPVFRLGNAELVQKNLVFLPNLQENVVGYQISGNATTDRWKNAMVVHNANPYPIKMELPGSWSVALRQQKFAENDAKAVRDVLTIDGIDTVILFQTK